MLGPGENIFQACLSINEDWPFSAGASEIYPDCWEMERKNMMPGSSESTSSSQTEAPLQTHRIFFPNTQSYDCGTIWVTTP